MRPAGAALGIIAGLALTASLAACRAGADDAGRRDAEAGAPAVPAQAAPADTLVLTAPGGTEVWFVQGREGRDSTGATCRERTMQLRRDGRRIPVPLLYTGEAPTMVNDSTLRAHIWLACRPGNLYDVNLRTGWPTRVMP